MTKNNVINECVTIQFRIPTETRDKIKARATEEGYLTISQYVRHIVIKNLAKANE